jgi:alkylation response protein AidB-like acyl-CoA dehydrogenase
MATGEFRFAYSMTEPGAGSDVQSIRTVAVRDGDEYVISGQKMWATNGLRSSGVMLLTRASSLTRRRGKSPKVSWNEPDRLSRRPMRSRGATRL